jgi:formate hydrogenlyase subunit 4
MIALQVEVSRMPVDDPSTHLELTMVHEVMILDHSGPELASILWGSAIKLMVGVAIIATLLNPWSGSNTLQSAMMNIALCIVIAVVIGTVESLVARLRLKTVPKYILISIAAGTVALLATTWRVGGLQ